MHTTVEFFTSVDILLFFGIASGVLSTFAYIPYIIDTAAKRTQPQRASWLIWSVLGSIAFVSQLYEGASSSLWFAGVQITGTIIVFVLSIWVGSGRYLTKTDYLILFAASVGLVLWYFTENAAYALAITISISLLGGIATVAKAYRNPDSETLVTWVVSFVASVCAILSVGEINFVILAYPLYLFTLYLAFIVAIVLGRARNKPGKRKDRSAPVKPVTGVGSLAAGMRTTADAVIIGAALVFVFNWVGGTRVLATGETFRFDANQHSNGSVLSNTAVSFMYPNNADRESVSVKLPAVSTISTNNDLPELSDEPMDSQRIVVVAVQLNDLEGDTPQVLDEQHLVARIAASKVRDWFAGNQAHASTDISAEPISLLTPKAKKPLSDLHTGSPTDVGSFALFPTGGQPFDKVSSGAHLNDNIEDINQLSELDSDVAYQVLDEDDPFAKLTVTSHQAHVVHRESAHITRRAPLVFGSTLIARATNGEWFQIHTNSEVPGYVHRSHVTVEAFAMIESALAK